MGSYPSARQLKRSGIRSGRSFAAFRHRQLLKVMLLLRFRLSGVDLREIEKRARF